MLAYHLRVDNIREFNRIIASLPERSKRDLQELIELNERNLAVMRRHYGVKAPSKTLLSIIEKVEHAREGKSFMLLKYVYSGLFEHPGKFVLQYERLPLHARFEFTGKEMTTVEVWILEAALYEDMCALYNAWASAQNRVTPTCPKSDRKHASALYRSMIVSVFNFIECFLNGLAYQHYLEHMKALSQAHKDDLTEWDSKRKQTRYLSLRQKLYTYQRIISSTNTATLQETNCPEMKFLLEKSKIVRDAIAHANPSVIEIDPEMAAKEELLMNPDAEEARQTVDAAIHLVRKLNEACKHSAERIDWLQDRGPDGVFPNTVFD